MEGAQCGAQFLTDPIRDCLMLPYAIGQLGPLPFFFLLHCLFVLCLHSLSSSLCSCLSVMSVHGFETNRSHDCLIPLPSSVGSPATTRLEFPVSMSSSMTHREWPLVLLWTVPAFPRPFSSLVTSGNDSSTTSVVKSDLKPLYIAAQSPVKSSSFIRRDLTR